MVRNRAGGDSTWARINAPFGLYNLDDHPAVDGWGRARGRAAARRHAKKRAPTTRAQHLRAESVAKGVLACATAVAPLLLVGWVVYMYVCDLVARGGY